MENPDFWHAKWQSGKIGFHRDGYHSALVKYWPNLQLNKSTTVLVPLCGKSSDMVWLAGQGHTIIGVEISKIAAKDFFEQNGIQYEISSHGKFEKFTGGNITILVGDFFDITSDDIPNVRAVYDRAALIALPFEMRRRYAEHLHSILDAGTQLLLITLAFNQSEMDGPPFSVTHEDVLTAFHWCAVKQLATTPPEDFRGINAFESIYNLQVK
jgi:thiopurine S-methyltransferase